MQLPNTEGGRDLIVNYFKEFSRVNHESRQNQSAMLAKEAAVSELIHLLHDLDAIRLKKRPDSARTNSEDERMWTIATDIVSRPEAKPVRRKPFPGAGGSHGGRAHEKHAYFSLDCKRPDCQE